MRPDVFLRVRQHLCEVTLKRTTECRRSANSIRRCGSNFCWLAAIREIAGYPLFEFAKVELWTGPDCRQSVKRRNLRCLIGACCKLSYFIGINICGGAKPS